MRKIWPFSFYFLYFSAVAVYAPYMVLFYQELGFSGPQIGALTGIIPLIGLVSVPLWTSFADQTNRHRLVMSLGMAVGILGLFALPFLERFFLVLGLAVIINFFFSPVSAFADNASMTMLAGRKDLIGRLRLGGTIGFGLSAPFAGLLVENYGLKMAFWGGAVLIFCSFLVSQRLVHNGGIKAIDENRGQISDLLRNPLWILFLISAFTCGFAFCIWRITSPRC